MELVHFLYFKISNVLAFSTLQTFIDIILKFFNIPRLLAPHTWGKAGQKTFVRTRSRVKLNLTNIKQLFLATKDSNCFMREM